MIQLTRAKARRRAKARDPVDRENEMTPAAPNLDLVVRSNSADWENRARELVEQGICSEIILDHRNNPQNTNRSTKWQTQ